MNFPRRYQVAEGQIARTQPFLFPADEGGDVGENLGLH